MNLLEFLEGNWQRPDNGLWEMRGDRRHFVHSKVMAWVAFDRMVSGVEHFRLDGPVDRWRQIRKRDPGRGLAKGYDARPQHVHPGVRVGGAGRGPAADPAGRLPARDDPRVSGTVDAIQRELVADGFVLRYRPGAGASDDGLPGDEGAFLACSFWLADALHGIGRHDEATELFERLVDLANDVGLLAEEYDPASAGRSATPRRRSATWAWSTRPGTCPGRARPRPACACRRVRRGTRR